LYELTVYLTNDMVMPGMPQVLAEYGAPTRYIGLSLSLYILGGCTLQIVLGPLADRYGKRRVLLGGAAFFLLATALVPAAQTGTQFLAIRFFQGMGSCFIFLGYAAIHELFDDTRAVKLTTLMGNTTVFAPLIGPVVGSAIIAVADWRAVFGTAFVLALVAWIGLYRCMPAERKPPVPVRAATLWRDYRRVFATPTFVLGILVAGLAITPLTAWIGLSPAILLRHGEASYGTYIAYQCAIFVGFILSTLAIQRAGELPLGRLLRQGGTLAFVGLTAAGLLYRQGHLFVLGMFVFSAGFGLFNGALIRIALTSTGVSMNLTSAAMSVFYCLIIAAGLELYNVVCERWDYALSAFALCGLPLGAVLCAALWYLAHGYDARRAVPA
jgi:DHA1 family multidrug/chloramphenicol efflux transport protein-like MFS transporter